MARTRDNTPCPARRRAATTAPTWTRWLRSPRSLLLSSWLELHDGDIERRDGRTDGLTGCRS